MQGDQKRQLYFRTQLFKIISVVIRDMSILVDFVESIFLFFGAQFIIIFSICSVSTDSYITQYQRHSFRNYSTVR